MAIYGYSQLLRNYLNVKDDPYEAIIFAYNKEMDQLVEANTTICEV
jgi:hypothetical protein